MSRMYTLTKQLTNPGSTNPLVQIAAPATFAYRIHQITITQNNVTTSSNGEVTVQRYSAAATVTAAVAGDFGRTSSGDPAPSLTLGTSATGYSASTSGTPTASQGPIIKRAFSILNGVLALLTPQELIDLPPSGIIGILMPTAPAGVYDFEISIEEIG